MPADSPGSIEAIVPRSLTIERLEDLIREIARSYRGNTAARVFIVGGGTAVHSGWRTSTIDANLFSEDEAVFDDVQGMKARLELNMEFARPEDFRACAKRKRGPASFHQDDREKSVSSITIPMPPPRPQSARPKRKTTPNDKRTLFCPWSPKRV